MTIDPKDAEIARLTAALAESEAAAEGALMILVQTQAERDAALAQVAGAYEAAAQITENDKTLHEWEHTAAIRALTPAHALAALSRRDAQMRAEGMRKAAGMVTLGDTVTRTQARILAAAEKEKGNG